MTMSMFYVFLQEHIRDIKWSVENMRAFVDKHQYKPIKAIIEHVRDGSTVRAFLLPDFYHITLMISGIRVSDKKCIHLCKHKKFIEHIQICHNYYSYMCRVN